MNDDFILDFSRTLTKNEQIHGFSKVIDYPATKDEIIIAAEENAADERTVELLHQLPDVTYNDHEELLEVLEELE